MDDSGSGHAGAADEDVDGPPLRGDGGEHEVDRVVRGDAGRQLVPRGVERSELAWTILGFADDDAAMTERRLKQANLVGPAGYISMEDGAVGGFVQRAVQGLVVRRPHGQRGRQVHIAGQQGVNHAQDPYQTQYTQTYQYAQRARLHLFRLHLLRPARGP